MPKYELINVHLLLYRPKDFRYKYKGMYFFIIFNLKLNYFYNCISMYGNNSESVENSLNDQSNEIKNYKKRMKI